MNDAQYLLASVYVDGEATADQRALAEADPDVMSEVARMAALRSAVRNVESSTDSARERAIDAAMAVFESRLHQAPLVDRSSVVRSMRRRPTYARALSIAAALVAVGAFGLVVANRLGGGSELDTAGSDAAVTEDRSGGANDRLQDVAEDEPANTTTAGDLSVAELAPSGATDDAADATVAAAEGGTASDAPASDQAVSDPPLRPDIDFDQPVTTAAELGSFGTRLLELEASGELGPTPNTRCPQPRILGETQYVFDGVPTTVLVAVDTELGVVLAIDPTRCTVLVEGPLF